MLTWKSYSEQERGWPQVGRHILAHYDDETIVVYQAYRPSIGHAAARDARFGGGGFSFERMSWIKPNFLWMMYRSGWGQKEGQEVTLAIRLRRTFFDEILAAAVHSSFVPERYADRAAWKDRVGGSDVRLQWDPDHDPHGGKLERRAIQLGLRGARLKRYASEAIVSIDDISAQVAVQRANVGTDALETPTEAVYPVSDPHVAEHLDIDAHVA